MKAWQQQAIKAPVEEVLAMMQWYKLVYLINNL